ncbi:MAG: DUF1569 domain-containing protein [Bacteroidetes bacterium]|nr:DUF1569 domain-containing protein [Bacteroidota bacterium]
MITESQKASLLSRMDKLSPQSKALWGRMNVQQMLAHMNDAFKISMGMKEAVDKSNWYTRNVMFPVAVYLLPAWPRSSHTAPEMNQEQDGTHPRDFYTELEFAKKMIDIFNEREQNKLKPHPMFGLLTKQQWSDLLVKHFKHHLTQFGV